MPQLLAKPPGVSHVGVPGVMKLSVTQPSRYEVDHSEIPFLQYN